MLAGTRLAEALGGTAALRSIGLMSIREDQMLASLEIVLAQPSGQYIVGLDPMGRLARENACRLSPLGAVLYIEGQPDPSGVPPFQVGDRFGTPIFVQMR